MNVSLFLLCLSSSALHCASDRLSRRRNLTCDSLDLLQNKSVEIDSVGPLSCPNATCNIVKMAVHGTAIVGTQLFRCCKELKRIVFKGEGYDCEEGDRWKEFLLEAKQRNVFLDDRATSCKNRGDDKCKAKGFIHHFICTDANHHCKSGVKKCNCTIYPGQMAVTVDCSNQAMRVDQLPSTLPILSRELRLENNQLNDSIGTWLEKVLMKTDFVDIVSLKRNNLSEIPPLARTRNKLKLISLEENKIKLDPSPLQSYLPYDNLRVLLAGNHYACNCDTQRFASFLKKNLKLISDYKLLFCTEARNVNETILIRPWTYDNPKCLKTMNAFQTLLNSIWRHSAIILMVMLNLCLIAVLINTQLALNGIIAGDVDARPWVDHVMQRGRRWYDLAKKLATQRPYAKIRRDAAENVKEMEGKAE